MYETTLADGTRALIRSVRPEDKHHLLLGFQHLSQRSRFFRFLRAVTQLSQSDLARFTAEGDEDNLAYGALDLSEVAPMPMGIVRYQRLEPGAREAEMAVTVVDLYQGRGVGTLLLGTVAFCAVRAGIDRFIAFVHPQNTAMAGLMTTLGAVLTESGSYENRFEMPLYGDPAEYPANRQGDVMREAYRLMAQGGAPGSKRNT